MWYLVLPPIIVVLSLIFLLWYLSNKGADPSVVEKMSHLEVAPAVSFSRTKEFFLRILEKLAQRSKVKSLRMHNALNDWTQSIKERRRQVRENVALQQSERGEESGGERVGFFARFKQDKRGLDQEPLVVDEVTQYQEPPVETLVPDDIVDTPIFRQKKTHIPEKPAGEIFPKRAHRIQIERPMVSETAAHPEEKKKRISPDTAREEMLIARIALNPKDFTAYETLGDYYFERENIKDAKECYRQVLKLSPVQRMVKIKIRRLEKFLSEQK